MTMATMGRIDESKLTEEQLVEYKVSIWLNGGNAYFSKCDEGEVIKYLFEEIQKLKSEPKEMYVKEGIVYTVGEFECSNCKKHCVIKCNGKTHLIE